jgi:hypothetical protein
LVNHIHLLVLRHHLSHHFNLTWLLWTVASTLAEVGWELGLCATQFVLLVRNFGEHPIFCARLRKVNVVWRLVSVLSLVLKLSIVSHVVWPCLFWHLRIPNLWWPWISDPANLQGLVRTVDRLVASHRSDGAHLIGFNVSYQSFSL